MRLVVLGCACPLNGTPTGSFVLVCGCAACGENPKVPTLITASSVRMPDLLRTSFLVGVLQRVYGNKGVTPMSRMGIAWIMRQKFEAAQKLIQQQEVPSHFPCSCLSLASSLVCLAVPWCTQDWCAKKPGSPARFPTDLSLDSLTGLLRGAFADCLGALLTFALSCVV